MFNSADSFAVFFFTCLALIILGIVFEDELIALETEHPELKDVNSPSTRVGGYVAEISGASSR